MKSCDVTDAHEAGDCEVSRFVVGEEDASVVDDAREGVTEGFAD